MKYVMFYIITTTITTIITIIIIIIIITITIIITTTTTIIIIIIIIIITITFVSIGTKVMCQEGGCGCCVVALTKPDPMSNKQLTLAVNSVSTLSIM